MLENLTIESFDHPSPPLFIHQIRGDMQQTYNNQRSFQSAQQNYKL